MRGDNVKETHRKILDYITGYMLEHGYPPTTREIAVGIGYGSTATINGYLREMRTARIINFADGCPRTITVPRYQYIQNTWIPVEERPPGNGETVWATVKHSDWISDYGTDYVPEEEKIHHPESCGVYKAKYIGSGIWKYADEENEWIHCDEVEKRKGIRELYMIQ